MIKGIGFMVRVWSLLVGVRVESQRFGIQGVRFGVFRVWC
jgi:hypothetical protein